MQSSLCEQRGWGCRLCSALEVQVPCGTAAVWYHSSFYFKNSLSKKCRWFFFFFHLLVLSLHLQTQFLSPPARWGVYLFSCINHRKLPRGWCFLEVKKDQSCTYRLNEGSTYIQTSVADICLPTHLSQCREKRDADGTDVFLLGVISFLEQVDDTVVSITLSTVDTTAQ